MINTVAWDALGEEGKSAYFAQVSGTDPNRHLVGSLKDLAQGGLSAMTNSLLTGTVIHIDGGNP